MRVLFLAHSFPRFPTDSAGSFVLRLARALADRGVEVEAVAPHAAGLEPHESLLGVPVHRFRYAPAASETLAYTGTMAEQVRGGLAGKLAFASLIGAGTRAALQHARRFRADLVHAHWWFPAGLAGAAVNRALGLPLVTTSHGSDVRLARTIPGGPRLLGLVVRRSAAFTTVSRWLADEIRRIVPAGAPLVAPMPVDVELFSPELDRDQAEAAPARLLFVGRLNEQKGVATLLRALALTRSACALDLIGEGPLDAELHALARELGVSERVAWYGNQSPVRLAGLYRRASALVVPSLDEGLGLVAVEAQLSATPVIAFASGGIVDVVRHEHTGLLVPAGDVAALAASIDRLAADRALARSLGRTGREMALARFAPAAVAERYASIYAAALAGRAT